MSKMIVSDEAELYYPNHGSETSIQEQFPEFYEANKERVDAGKIKFFYDPWATSTGCLIDLETLENYIIDTRA